MFGTGVVLVAASLAVVYTPIVARVVRAAVLAVKAEVYVDGARFGGIESLSLIQATPILEIRFLSASEATSRFGTGNSGGAIVITTRI